MIQISTWGSIFSHHPPTTFKKEAAGNSLDFFQIILMYLMYIFQCSHVKKNLHCLLHVDMDTSLIRKQELYFHYEYEVKLLSEIIFHLHLHFLKISGRHFRYYFPVIIYIYFLNAVPRKLFWAFFLLSPLKLIKKLFITKFKKKMVRYLISSRQRKWIFPFQKKY